jgi:stage II sporulation protein P
VHDLGPYDYPNYNGSYSRAGLSIARWLEKYPSIRIVLDVHRDALVAEDGTVYKTATEVNGEKTAQIMLVVGSDAGGQGHSGWRDNLALATAVQSGMNADYPTLARPMILRSSRFNQHLSPGALLVEVGSHGNTLRESLAAARLFAASLSETLKVLSADKV